MRTLAIILVSILSMPAWAGPGDAPAWAEHAYVGLGASLATDAFESDGDYDSTNGWDVLAGYRPDEHWAIEAQFQKLQRFDRDQPDGEVSNTAYTLAGKMYPMTGEVQPFALLGGGLLNSRQHGSGLDTETTWVGVMGGGIDFKLTPQIVLEGTLRYLLPTGQLNEFDFWTAGANVQFRF